MKLKLKNVRLAFPDLFKAKAFNGEGDPKYGATFLIPKDHPQIKEIQAAIKQVAEDKWKDKAAAELKVLQAKDKLCLHDGDLKDKFDGFAGHYYLSARADRRPTVVDSNREPLSADDGKPYSGCYVNAIVDVWPMDNQFGKRINATLSGVQFHKDGEAFGGSAPADASEFDDESEAGDAPGSEWD